MKSNTLSTEMKPSHLAIALNAMLAVKQPVFVWGPPGVGKSQIVSQVAAARKQRLIDIRAILLDPVDLRGLPTVNGDGRAHWATPDFLPRDGEGVLFLDELNAAPPLTQASCYQLVLDRRLGEYELPEGWTVVAAGNRETDKGVASRMPTPLANRFVHFETLVDVDDWCKWAIQAQLRPEVIAFIRFRRELLHQFEPKSASRAFPTPRSWEFVSRALKAIPKDVEYPIIAGTVGAAAAAEFVGFLRVFRKLPNPDAILLDPENSAVPEDPATLYAISTNLARRAKDDNFERIWKYAKRLPAEFTVLLIADAVRRDKNLAVTPSFIEFGAQFSDVIL